MTLGIFCLMSISLYIYNEFNFDRHIPDSKNIYRATFNWRSLADKEEINLSWALSSLPQQLTDYCPEIESVTGISKFKDRAIVKVDSKIFQEDNFFETDTSFFSVFKTQPLSGAFEKDLSESIIVLTESLSKKYFGSNDPISQIVSVNDTEYKVAAVIKDAPLNSTLRYEALIFTLTPISTDWCLVFFKLRQDASNTVLEKKINDLFLEQNESYLAQTKSTGSYEIEGLVDIHLGSAKLFDAPKGNSQMLYLLFTLGILIMLVSCINYVNISLGIAGGRRVEMGMRRIFGASKVQSQIQFIFELLLMAVICFIIVCLLLLLFWQQLINVGFPKIEMNTINFVTTSSAVLLCILFLSLSSGLYISSRINSSSFVNNLKQLSGTKRNHFFRNALLTFQFTVSVCLIFGSVVVVRQTQLIMGGDSKFNAKEVMVIDIPNDESIKGSITQFKQSVERLPHTQSISLTSRHSLPTSELDYELFRVNVNGQDKIKTFAYAMVDENYFNVLNIPILLGRSYTETEFHSEDGNQWEFPIVNESFVQNQEWIDDPLKQKISHYSANVLDEEVLGVTANFGFEGLHKKTKPMIFYPNKEFPEVIMIRFSIIDEEKIKDIKAIWQKEMKSQLEYKFLNDYFATAVEKESDLQYLMVFFSACSILITILGLLGLINVNLNEQRKGIAIRGVFGASELSLLMLTWKEYALLFLIAIFVGYPISIIFLKNWLEDFPEKTSLSITVYFLALTIIAVTVLVAIVYHLVQIKRVNYLKWIKDEI